MVMCYKYKKVESALYLVFLVLYDDDIYKVDKQLRGLSSVGNWSSTQFKDDGFKIN